MAKRARRLRKVFLTRSLLSAALLCAALLCTLTSCSPAYVLRAGWEEAGILLRREEIATIVQQPTVDAELKRKLELVLAARDFAKEIGLDAADNFTTYSKIDRDVLVWVLSAAEKTSFDAYTWWFPIVGSVPYKGFFEKEDGIAAQNKLKKKGYDTFLRPSAAFSTLGWFNDPLLSTTLRADDISLADTVIHEILHSTVWIKNSVPFNETLANFVGAYGARELFLKLDGPDSLRAKAVTERWTDEIRFARFLERTIRELTLIYDTGKDGAQKDVVLEKREAAYDAARKAWDAEAHALLTPHYKNSAKLLNNAVIVAHQIYLTKPWLFEELFAASGGTVPLFVESIRKLAKEAETSNRDPFMVLEEMLGNSSL